MDGGQDQGQLNRLRYLASTYAAIQPSSERAALFNSAIRSRKKIMVKTRAYTTRTVTAITKTA